jgi:hypothetical protein
MSAKSEIVSLINDIRLDYDRGQGTLGEVRDRLMEIVPRALAEDDQVVIPREVLDTLTEAASWAVAQYGQAEASDTVKEAIQTAKETLA